MDEKAVDVTARERRRSGARFILGAFLILVGVLLIAENLGFEVPFEVWSYWPFLLIGLGVAKLVLDEGEGRGGGYWLLLAGIYCWLSVFRIAGLSWGTAWPVYLLGLGLWILIGRTVCSATVVRIGERRDVS